jgi:hypothetical protein
MKSIECNTTKQISAVFLGLALFLLGTVNISFAKDITLVWDPSPSPNIAGYNVYYQVNTSSFPFNGTELSEGASPINVGGPETSSLTINLPEDDNIYYFTVSAVNDAGLESSISNIAATEWIPALLAPAENATVDSAATFVWNQPPVNFKPSTSIVSFDLIYGTDPNLNENAMAFTAPNFFNTDWPQPGFNVVTSLTIMLFLLMAIRKSVWRPVRIGICIGVFVLQASCGGGGGGGDSDESEIMPNTSAPVTSAPVTSAPVTSDPVTSDPVTSDPVTSDPVTDPSSLFTNVITDIYATEYEVTDLQPSTQYYWKIIAVDNWGVTYESITQNFTTQSD